jgi:hypothetical protein
MALRMSTGNITGTELEDQAQWAAADVDQNGLVQAKDAWMINQYTVGNQPITSEVGTWEFVDSSADLTALSANNAALPTESLTTPIALNQSEEQLSMTAVLNGDVNGSYVDYL